jgi:serine/threonine protein kinase
MLHRDVKLDNMLYAGDRFVLLDFGIGEVVGYSELMDIARVGGTFGYMAPELLLEGQSEINPSYAIDIFSAGMTLLSVFDQRPLDAMKGAQILFYTSGSREPLVDFVSKPLDISGAPPETHSLLAAMVDFDPMKRPEAKKLLKHVSDFVDLDEKISLIEAQNQVRLGTPIASATGTNERDESSLEGPHQSWKAIEDEIYRVLETVRPEYFIVEINGGREEDMVYVQAITDGQRWHVEAMSEVFSAESQTTEVKRNFMKLNWTPPTASDPNFSVDLDAPPHAEIVRLFTDAFEFAYGIAPRDIRSIQITTQGTGKY